MPNYHAKIKLEEGEILNVTILTAYNYADACDTLIQHYPDANLLPFDQWGLPFTSLPLAFDDSSNGFYDSDLWQMEIDWDESLLQIFNPSKSIKLEDLRFDKLYT